MDLLTLIAKLAEADFGRLVGIAIILSIVVWLRIASWKHTLDVDKLEYESKRSEREDELEKMRIAQRSEDAIRHADADAKIAASNNRLADVIDMTVSIMGRVEERQSDLVLHASDLSDNYQALRQTANVTYEHMGKAFKRTGEKLNAHSVALTKTTEDVTRTVNERSLEVMRHADENKVKLDTRFEQTNLLITQVMKDMELARSEVSSMGQTLNALNGNLGSIYAPQFDALQQQLTQLSDHINIANSNILKIKKGTNDLKPETVTNYEQTQALQPYSPPVVPNSIPKKATNNLPATPLTNEDTQQIIPPPVALPTPTTTTTTSSTTTTTETRRLDAPPGTSGDVA